MKKQKKLVGELKDIPFAFMFDKWSWAVQNISSAENNEFGRITVDSLWKLKHLPASKKYGGIRKKYPQYIF